MKIRILNTEEMGTDLRLENGDIVEVIKETKNTYRMVNDHYCFDREWQDIFWEVVEENSVTKLTDNHYVDVQGWSEDKIKKAAEMFSEHTGLPIWDGEYALHVLHNDSYLTYISDGDIFVCTDYDIEDKEEISQENFNQLLEEWEMQKKTSDVMNCEPPHSSLRGAYVYTASLTPEQYEMLGDALVEAGFKGEYPNDQFCFDDEPSWAFGVRYGENYHGIAGCFENGRELSFEQFMRNLKPEHVLLLEGGRVHYSAKLESPSTTILEAPVSSSELSLVQRITLAHKAAQNASQEAVEAYNKYKELVEELKDTLGQSISIEAVKWEDLFYTPVGCNMNDWRNWKIGDVVECVEENDEFDIGHIGVITNMEGDDYDGTMPVEVDDEWPSAYRDGMGIEDIFKWVKRP